LKPVFLLQADADFTCARCYWAKDTDKGPICRYLDRPIVWNPRTYFRTDYAITDDGEEGLA